MYDILWTLTFLSLTHFYDQVCTWKYLNLFSNPFSVWVFLLNFPHHFFNIPVFFHCFGCHIFLRTFHLHQHFFQPMSCRLRRLAGWAMNGLQHFLCGNFLGRFDDHHASAASALAEVVLRRFFSTVVSVAIAKPRSKWRVYMVFMGESH